MYEYVLPSAYCVKDLIALIPGLVDVFGNHNGINTEGMNFGNVKNISEANECLSDQTGVINYPDLTEW